jgi:hypothetical protein
MGNTPRTVAWIQTALLSLAFLAVGSGAVILLYGSAVATVRESARAALLETAQLAANAVDAPAHAELRAQGDERSAEYQAISSSLVRIVGTVGGVQRISTVRRTDKGLVTVLNVSRTAKSSALANSFLTKAPELPRESMRVWRDGTIAATIEPTLARGEPVQYAFVPLFATDRTVDAVLVVESDYGPVAASIEGLKAALWLCLFGVLAASVLSSWALTTTVKGVNFRIAGKVELNPTSRVWLTLGLLTVSAALVSDGALSFATISRSNVAAREASESFQHTLLIKDQLEAGRTTGWTARFGEAAEFFDGQGDAWLASKIEGYIEAARRDEGVEAAESGLLSALRLNDARVRGDLWEAGNQIQIENSQQGYRLVASVVLGIVSLALMGAISVKEKQLKQEIDSHVGARKHYENLMGCLPIGMFAYRDGQVQFTSGAWIHTDGEEPEDLLSAMHPEDREQINEALKDAELRRMPFSLILRFVGSGDTYYYETNGAVVTNEDGTYRHVLVFCADVTPIVTAKLEVQRKHREVDEKNYQLSAALRQVEHSLHTIVKTMVRAVEIKDPYTAGHSERVRQYCVWMAEHFELSPYEVRILSYGALIHDVGKIGIPDELLLKPGKLSAEEFETIKLHTVHGANIVADIEMFRDCAPIVRWHHERLDGSGYPDGISGDEIPFLVRVVAVADVFDAMTSDRAYRLCVTEDEAFEVMAGEVAEGKLDAMAFAALKAVIERHGLADLDVIRGGRRAA